MTLSFDHALERFQPDFPLGVALSGGADSTALLVACARRWPQQVVALHVNHGLQAAAAQFEAACRALCAQWQVPLRVAHIDARHAPGQSPEDAARSGRYAALARLALEDGDGGVLTSIALAQHADDQVETLLLALARCRPCRSGGHARAVGATGPALAPALVTGGGVRHAGMAARAVCAMGGGPE